MSDKIFRAFRRLEQRVKELQARLDAVQIVLDEAEDDQWVLIDLVKAALEENDE